MTLRCSLSSLPLLIFSLVHRLLCLFSSTAAFPPSVIDIILGVRSSLFCVSYFSGGQLGLKGVGGLLCICTCNCLLTCACVRMVTMLAYWERIGDKSQNVKGAVPCSETKQAVGL